MKNNLQKKFLTVTLAVIMIFSMYVSGAFIVSAASELSSSGNQIKGEAVTKLGIYGRFNEVIRGSVTLTSEQANGDGTTEFTSDDYVRIVKFSKDDELTETKFIYDTSEYDNKGKVEHGDIFVIGVSKESDLSSFDFYYIIEVFVEGGGGTGGEGDTGGTGDTDEKYTVTYSVKDNTGGEISVEGNLDTKKEGTFEIQDGATTAVVFKATPDKNYRIKGWTVNDNTPESGTVTLGDADSEGNTYYNTLKLTGKITADTKVMVEFEKETREIKFTEDKKILTVASADEFIPSNSVLGTLALSNALGNTVTWTEDNNEYDGKPVNSDKLDVTGNGIIEVAFGQTLSVGEYEIGVVARDLEQNGAFKYFKKVIRIEVVNESVTRTATEATLSGRSISGLKNELLPDNTEVKITLSYPTNNAGFADILKKDYDVTSWFNEIYPTESSGVIARVKSDIKEGDKEVTIAISGRLRIPDAGTTSESIVVTIPAVAIKEGTEESATVPTEIEVKNNTNIRWEFAAGRFIDLSVSLTVGVEEILLKRPSAPGTLKYSISTETVNKPAYADKPSENTILYDFPVTESGSVTLSKNSTPAIDVTRKVFVQVYQVDSEGSITGYGEAWIVPYRKGEVYVKTADVPQSNTPDFYIDLMVESIVLPSDYIVAAFSVNGGIKWKKMGTKHFDDVFLAKLLSKEMNLMLSNEALVVRGAGKGKPSAEATIVVYAPIGARPKFPKLTVNYAVKTTQIVDGKVTIVGEYPGEWGMAERDATVAYDDEKLLIAKIEGKTVGTFDFLSVGDTTKVKEFQAEKPVKDKYAIKTAPLEEKKDTSDPNKVTKYIPASKSKKITVLSTSKAPKLVERGGLIKHRRGTVILSSKLSPLPHTVGYMSELGAYVTTANEIVTMYVAPTSKKPASKKAVSSPCVGPVEMTLTP